MRLPRVATIISALLLMVTATIADAGVMALPSAQINIDGQTFDIPVEFDDSEGAYILGPFSRTTPTARIVNFDGFYDPDPELIYAMSIIDTGAPSSITLTFSLPMVPSLSNASEVRAQVSGSMTDRVENGVSITPLLPDLDGDGDAEIQVMSLGSPLSNSGVDVGEFDSFTPASSMSTHTKLYGPYMDGPQPGAPGGPLSLMQVTTSVLLSGDGDAFALQGNTFAIPEPSAWALACLGLGAFFSLRGRRIWA